METMTLNLDAVYIPPIAISEDNSWHWNILKI